MIQRLTDEAQELLKALRKGGAKGQLQYVQVLPEPPAFTDLHEQWQFIKDKILPRIQPDDYEKHPAAREAEKKRDDPWEALKPFKKNPADREPLQQRGLQPSARVLDGERQAKPILQQTQHLKPTPPPLPRRRRHARRRRSLTRRRLTHPLALQSLRQTQLPRPTKRLLKRASQRPGTTLTTSQPPHHRLRCHRHCSVPETLCSHQPQTRHAPDSQNKIIRQMRGQAVSTPIRTGPTRTSSLYDLTRTMAVHEGQGPSPDPAHDYERHRAALREAEKKRHDPWEALKPFEKTHLTENSFSEEDFNRLREPSMANAWAEIGKRRASPPPSRCRFRQYW